MVSLPPLTWLWSSRLDSVISGGYVQNSAIQDDPAFVGIFIVNGLQAVSPGVNSNSPFFDSDGISAAQPVVDRADRDVAAGDNQVVFGPDAVVGLGFDGERTGAVDGQVTFAENGGIGLIFRGAVYGTPSSTVLLVASARVRIVFLACLV
jgi:hypothetical protein